ncbi:receptor-like protein 9DC3 [Phaseolus vulgaris]|uniref:receptor-like protein 9DC3 n=1 Tax=Phaseolus vulgaris TaxID=3885 RepID=UPI0035CADB07
MESWVGWFLLLCSHWFLFLFSFSHSLCHLHDKIALLQFKNSLAYVHDYYYSDCDNFVPKMSTWENGTDCCSWSGVLCHPISGHVIGLDLACNRLSGEIHPNTSLFRLSHLQSLNLTFNYFYSSQLSFPSVGYVNLTHLNISNYEFRSEIPSQISQLSKLESLDLSFTRLMWKENSWKKFLQNATVLAELILDGVNMTFSSMRSLNLSTSLVNLSLKYTGVQENLKTDILCLPKLKHLWLSDNSLEQFPNLSCSAASLTMLDLSRNMLEGTIPASFSNFTHITFLDLSSNYLKGSIPSSILTLPHLTFLDLGYNRFSGQIPSSLSNLQHLLHLDLSENRLEGPLPNKITGLSNLTFLFFTDNLLNGTIPTWCLSLPFLQELDLSENQFTGHIPSISSQSLKSLYLCYNKLHGNIPQSVFTLVNLTHLCLSSNNFNGLHNYTIFTNAPLLERLYLSSVGLTEFPKLLGKIPILIELDLSNNKLNGTMPKWLHEMGSLQFLSLSHNLLTTPINQFSRNYNLNILDISFNLLTGDMSSSICNASNLQVLILSHNKLTGVIPPCLANLWGLYILDLQRNKLNGTLPNNFSMNSELAYFNVNDNQLEGPLPKSLSNCTQLEILNLGNNQIEDKFPHWLQTLPMLTVLVLRSNKLYGPIDDLETQYEFSSIVIFDISSNYFNGPIPKTYIQNFKAMKNVISYEGDELYIGITYMPYNGSQRGTIGYVTVTTKAISMTLKQIPKNFVTIDLSQNKFQGQIPYVIGELHALRGLNFSHNRLSGLIPKSIGYLTNLESMDLSSNMFTGRIPTELTNLNYLEVLNLSNNQLVGEIPQGKQFATFSNDSYLGNSGLCGFPLSMSCNNTEQKPPSSPSLLGEERFGFGWEPVVIGYGCGMIFGIGLRLLYYRKT